MKKLFQVSLLLIVLVVTTILPVGVSSAQAGPIKCPKIPNTGSVKCTQDGKTLECHRAGGPSGNRVCTRGGVVVGNPAGDPLTGAKSVGPNKGPAIHSESTFGSLQSIVTELFKILFLFIPFVATLYLVLSGYRYIIAQGNPDLIEKAKQSLTYAILGIIIAYSAVAIIATFGRAIGVPTGF